MQIDYIIDQQFSDITYSESDIKYKEYEDCIFRNSDFRGCNFEDVTFIDCKFIDCNFRGAELNQVSFRDVGFIKCDFTTVHFTMSHQILDKFYFRDSLLDYAKFYNLKLNLNDKY